MLLIGEAFVECDEDFANEYLEKKSQGASGSLSLSLSLSLSFSLSITHTVYSSSLILPIAPWPGITEQLAGFDSEEESIKERMGELKKTLYKKFGDSINLEN